MGRRLVDLAWFGLAVVVLIGSFVFSNWKKNSGNKKKRRRGGFRFSVKTHPAIRGTIRQLLPLSGDIQALRKVTLYSEVTGIVRKIYARDGDALKGRKLLLQLNAWDQTLTVRKQKALLLQAQAALQRSKAILSRDRDRYQRLLRLRKSRSVSESDVIQGRFQYRASQGTLEEAKAQIALRQAELKMARRELSKTSIRTPFASRVSKLHVEVGQRVQAGTALADLVGTEGVECRLYVPLRHLSKVQSGMSVSLRVSGFRGSWVKSTLTSLLPQADSSSRNRTVIIRLKNPPPEFLPGLPLQARLTLNTRNNALIVKKDALTRFGNRWVLYTVRKGKAQMVPVKMLNEENGRVEVRGALKAGDAVVHVGNEGLFPNAPVSTRNPFSKKGRKLSKR